MQPNDVHHSAAALRNGEQLATAISALREGVGCAQYFELTTSDAQARRDCARLLMRTIANLTRLVERLSPLENRRFPSSRSALARWAFVLKTLSTERSTTTLQLATQWDVSYQTIKRDLEALRELGVDIEGTHLGIHLVGGNCPLCQNKLGGGR